MKVLKKKILPEYFEAVISGMKRFELRKDDNNVQAGDKLRLCEFDNGYTGREVTANVTYTLRNAEQYGLMPGYVIIGIEVSA